MNQDKLKQDFINAFGEDKWNEQEMLSKLMPIHKELCEYLGIEMVPVIFEDIEEDSRFYFKEQYIVISRRMLPRYSDVLKSLVHEVRHGYQYYCIFNPNNENPTLVKNWKQDLDKLINASEGIDALPITIEFARIKKADAMFDVGHATQEQIEDLKKEIIDIELNKELIEMIKGAVRF